MIEQIRLVGYGRDVCKPEKERVYTIPDFHMIHFIESGNGWFNGIKLKGGQAFVCRQDKLCHYFPDKDNPWTYTWINVKGVGADRLIDSLPLKDDTFLWNLYDGTPHLKKIWEYKNSPSSEELMALSALYNIFAEALFKRNDIRRDYVEEAKVLFQSRFGRGITVEEVAKKLNISRAYLRNIFYEKESISPQSYLMKLRMNRAAELLKGDYSVTEIAAAIGYGDVLQFSKMFSKYFGLSPTEYKRQLAKV